jgi:hypothetical protein
LTRREDDLSRIDRAAAHSTQAARPLRLNELDYWPYPDEIMAETTFYLFNTEDCTRAGSAAGHAGDIEFPASVGGWTEVMDCRHAPYTDKSLAENCDIASHVRKKYILVDEAQLSNEHPSS